jgi:carbon-monoxide dehydrogenase small subunit
MAKMHIKLTVNNRDVEILAESRLLLIHLLREELWITGQSAAIPAIAAPAPST